MERFEWWRSFITTEIGKGSVVGVQGDYNPETIALLLALIDHKDIFVPFSSAETNLEKKLEIAEVEYLFKFEDTRNEFKKISKDGNSGLILSLRQSNTPGIILFSSGSTGDPKAAVHDFSKLLTKFMLKRKAFRSINFLSFDHWGGLNTLLHIIANNGVIGIVSERTPQKVCEFIEKYKIELLPTTPTFINLILMSHAYEQYDLSSLKVISYGSESMPESTLKHLHEILPNVDLKQTYGLTELGVLRTKSRNSDSLWVKVGGEGFETKIEEGILYIKAESTILGYLNSTVPIDINGWYNTGDRVEQDGEWIKFLGRDSDIINVGGQKVYPAEVESVLLEISNIKDVTIYAVKNNIMGQIVGAKIQLFELEDLYVLKKRIHSYCKGKLESYKIPMLITISDDLSITERFKKDRKKI